MKKKVKVIMLPTNDKTKLFIGKVSKQLQDLAIADKDDTTLNQHLYLVSNDEIKEGDYFIDYEEAIGRVVKDHITGFIENIQYPKIMVSTNSSLNLTLIPDSFIKEYAAKEGKINEVYIDIDPRTNQVVLSDNLDKEECIITPIKDSYTRKEVIELCQRAYFEKFNFTSDANAAFLKFVKENL